MDVAGEETVGAAGEGTVGVANEETVGAATLRAGNRGARRGNSPAALLV